jgi:Ran GTPase-activating protein (RanGAP) involved in mRNA processing and transport
MKQFETTNRDLLRLYKGLEAVKTIKGARFAVLVGKNMKELREVLDPIERAAIPTMEFQELSVAMQRLIEAEDNDAIESLEKENTELIEQRKKQLDDVENMLDETIKVYLHPIREDQLPEEITGEQIERLLEIIE